MKFKLSKLIENNQMLMFLSLICSITLWLGVVSIDKESTKTVRNIPVQMNITDSAAGRLGLSPILKSDILVDAEIVGERAVVGNIGPDEVGVRAVLTGITKPGTYQIRLEGYEINGNGFDIVIVKPSTVEVKFDHIVSKKFPVVVELEGLTIPEGFIMDQEYISPKEVMITGPSAEIDRISKCAVKILVDESVSQTTTFEREIEIYNNGGVVIKSDFLEMDISKTFITIPVLKKKEVPLTVGFTNIPAGFDLDSLKYTINPSNLEVAGPSELVDGLYEIPLGYIDMRTLSPDMAVYYGAVLPTGYISVDNVQDVSVEFKSSGYEKKKFKVTDIRQINIPSDYIITTNTKAIFDVEIYGPKEDIAKLTALDIVAEIDIANTDIRVGQIVVPVNICIPASKRCWAFGEYNSVITVKNK